MCLNEFWRDIVPLLEEVSWDDSFPSILLPEVRENLEFGRNGVNVRLSYSILALSSVFISPGDLLFCILLRFRDEFSFEHVWALIEGF